MLPCSFIRRNSETWEQIIIFKTIFYMHTYVSIYICASLSLSLSFWFRCIYIYTVIHTCKTVVMRHDVNMFCFDRKILIALRTFSLICFPPMAYKKRATWAFPSSLMVKTLSFQHKGYYWFWFSCSYTSK